MFFKKKKISIKSVIKNSIIILFGIPVRIIKICFFLWRSEYDTKTSLLQMYYENYFSAKELKIEFIDKKVYLNCSNREIASLLKKIHKNKSQEELAIMYKILIEVNEKMKKDIESYSEMKKIIPAKLGILETEEGFKIKNAHYTLEHKKEGLRIATHATSNVPSFLSNTQFKSVAMYSLLKNGSLNPGSVITIGMYKFNPKDSVKKFVNNWEVQKTIWEVEAIRDKCNFRDIFIYWDWKIREALQITHKSKNSLYEEEFIKKATSGHFSLTLESDRNKTISEIIEDIIKEREDKNPGL